MSRPTRAELRHRKNDKKLWKSVVAAAQATYRGHEEHGLSDEDMERAIRAGLDEWTRHSERLPVNAE